MTRRTGWVAIGSELAEDDLKRVLGASAGARNVVLEQRMREVAAEAAGEGARPTRPAPSYVPPPPRQTPPPALPRANPPRTAVRPMQPLVPAASRASLVDDLERLAELRARGLITDEEFAAAKRRLLASR